jgi:hypothetical protein
VRPERACPLRLAPIQHCGLRAGQRRIYNSRPSRQPLPRLLQSLQEPRHVGEAEDAHSQRSPHLAGTAHPFEDWAAPLVPSKPDDSVPRLFVVELTPTGGTIHVLADEVVLQERRF